VTPSAKPATLRFYVDADVLGLAKILVQLRADVTYPGDPGGTLHRRARPACPVTSPAAPDTEWVPEVTQQGWLIITRDAHISLNRREIDAVRDAHARMVTPAGSEARGTWEQLEIVMSRWRDIEALLDTSGPFIFSATRTRLRPISLT
jgi:hypothetical protein